MPSFDEAVRFVLQNEGGLSDDPADKDGMTHFGITTYDLATAISDEIVPRDTNISNLTKNQAIDIYKTLYWDELHLDKITAQSVSSKILDSCVNIGLKGGIICLQRAIRSATGDLLDEDGILGSVTINAINDAPAASLLSAYRAELANYYRRIVERRPSQSVFLSGWLARAAR